MGADEWNRLHPVGTWVRWRVRGERNHIDARTRRPAYHLSSGAAVVPLQDYGAKPIDELEIVPVPQTANV